MRSFLPPRPLWSIRAFLGSPPNCHDIFGAPVTLPAPTTAEPGSEAKIRILVARFALGLSLHHPDDCCRPLPTAFRSPVESSQPAPDERDNTLLTIDDLARLVNRTRRTVYDEHRLGYMPSPRQSDPLMWAWGDVRDWLERRFKVRLPERLGLRA